MDGRQATAGSHPRRVVRLRPSSPRQAGVALVLVLGVMSVVAIMAVHMAATSEVVALESKVLSERVRLQYAAESAADRAFWLLLHDRKVFANRSLGVIRTENLDSEAEEWMADGRIHVFELEDGGAARVSIGDAATGLDISGPGPETRLRSQLPVSTEDLERQDAINHFLDVLADYTDTDDFVRLQGRERDDYEAEGYPGLPRNAPIQYRDEVCWLRPADQEGPAGDELTRPSAYRVIPPPGRAFPRVGRPSLFSTPPGTIRQLASLSPAELTAVLDAVRRWQKDHEPLTASLDPNLYARLRQRFSLDESGVYTISVEAEAAGIRRTLHLTRDVQTTFARGPASRPWLVNWEAIGL